ncbi:MAG: hypothetical protein KKG60_03985 [Nanoarchaeota archaeon]|nr:hypothetical protein [Nanoarchaeota archaeon]
MNKKGDMVIEKKFLWVAYLVFAVLIFLAAASFVRSNATKQAFTRDFQSRDLAILIDTISFSPRDIQVTYTNDCCEFNIKQNKITLKLPTDILEKPYPFLTPQKFITSQKDIKGDILFKKTSEGITINEKSPI